MVSKYKGIIILWNLFWVMSFIHLWPIALAQRTRTKLLYDAVSCHGHLLDIQRAVDTAETMVCDFFFLFFPFPRVCSI